MFFCENFYVLLCIIESYAADFFYVQNVLFISVRCMPFGNACQIQRIMKKKYILKYITIWNAQIIQNLQLKTCLTFEIVTKITTFCSIKLCAIHWFYDRRCKFCDENERNYKEGMKNNVIIAIQWNYQMLKKTRRQKAPQKIAYNV